MDQETQLTEPPLSAPAADVALLHELVDHLRTIERTCVRNGCAGSPTRSSCAS